MTTTLSRAIPLTIDDCAARGCACSSCGLRSDTRFRPVPGYGNPEARLIIVGEAPGGNEVGQLEPFVGESGQILDQALEEEINRYEPDASKHIHRGDLYITNAVLCRPPDNRDPSASEIAACGQRLRQEILSLVNRKVILILGTTATRAILGKNAPAISNKLYHNEWNAEFDCHLVFAYHPAACLRSPDMFPDFLAPLKTAIRLLDAESGPKKSFTPPYIVENDHHKCVERLDRMMKLCKGVMACDIETAGRDDGDALLWQKGWITQLGFYHPAIRTVYLIPCEMFRFPAVIQHLKRLFQSKIIEFLWQNGKFDVQFLRQLLGFVPRIDQDTLLLHYTLDERRGGSGMGGGSNHGLKVMAAKYCGASDYASEKDDYTDPVYHAKDCYYTYEVYHRLLAEHLREKPSPDGYPLPLQRYKNVLLPAWNAMARVEMHGVQVDREKLPKVKAEKEELIAQLEQECQRLASVTFPRTIREPITVPLPVEYYKKTGKPKPQKTRREYRETVKQEPMNLQSNAQMRWFLYDHLGLPHRYARGAKGDTPTVNKEMLEEFRDRHPFIDRLLKYRAEQKLYSTYIIGAERVSQVDGLVHTHFSLSATVTGRPSSSDLNLQNLPKTESIRELYIARPGHYFVEYDYNNQEVRVAALLARSKTLRDALAHGDYHMDVAQRVLAKEFAYIEEHAACDAKLRHLLEHHPAFSVIRSDYNHKPIDTETLYKELRKFAKGVTFGILYGQGAKGLSERLSVEEGVAASYIREYLGRFPDLIGWLKRMRKYVSDPGFVSTPFGHYRRFPFVTDRTIAESERQALNAPIQSTASDGTMLSLITLERELPKRGYGYPILFVHDSIEFEIKQQKIREAVPYIKSVMEHAYDGIMHDLDFYVPFPVEGHIGHSWYDMTKKVNEEEKWFAEHPESVVA